MRNAVVVIGLRLFAILGIVDGLLGMQDGVVDVVQLVLQLCYLALVGVVLYPIVVVLLLCGG